MMPIKLRIISLSPIIVIAVVMLCISCTKFVAVAPPETQIETSKVFTNDQTAQSAIAGLYNRMILISLGLTNGGGSIYPALSADELYNSSANSDLDMFTNNVITPDNDLGLLRRLWSPAYKTIFNCNAILEGLQNSSGVSDSLKAQYQGEVLVVRALDFFYLTNLYGDVPIPLSTNYETNSTLSSTPYPQALQQLVNDLIKAKNLLQPNYPSVGRVRVNKYVATALLARAYLFQKDWANAAAQATEVINNTALYNLSANLASVFTKSSTEAIWQVMRETANTVDGSVFIPSSTTVVPAYVIRPSLVAAFDSLDARRQNWIGKNTVRGVDYYYPAKYKIRSSSTVTEYQTIIRLAEIYLIRAEALAQQNNLSAGLQDLNVIRNRAGVSASNAITKQDLLNAVINERRLELFTEWGHRWLDLKRWNLSTTVLSPLKGSNWQATDTLYPKPLTEIQANPSLRQNAGY